MWLFSFHFYTTEDDRRYNFVRRSVLSLYTLFLALIAIYLLHLFSNKVVFGICVLVSCCYLVSLFPRNTYVSVFHTVWLNGTVKVSKPQWYALGSWWWDIFYCWYVFFLLCFVMYIVWHKYVIRSASLH